MKLFDMGLKKTLLVLLKPQPQLHCCRDIAAGRSWKNPSLLAIAAIAPRDHIFELRLVQGCHVKNTQAASQSQIQLLVEVAVVPHGISSSGHVPDLRV